MATLEKENGGYGKYSCILSDTLDVLGYNMDIINYRQWANYKIDEIYNSKAFSEIHITTGSKGNGTSLYYESDIDRMYVVKDIVCVRNIDSALMSTLFKDKTIFLIDNADSKPGYTRLQLMQLAERDHTDEVREALVREDNYSYISNAFSFFKSSNQMTDQSGSRINEQGRHGPAAKFANSFIKYDFVFGFLYLCSDLMEKWTSRPRNGDWPSKELITHISKCDGHIVPVANKESRHGHTEWRICFTLGELALMHSLEEFQIKLYVIIKLIANVTLKPICKEITAYIMKNVAFWMFERVPSYLFSKCLLFDRLRDTLEFLRSCIEECKLSSYMIEDRNLFEGRISCEERALLSNKISELIDMKENVFVHCPKICIAMAKMKNKTTTLFVEGKKITKTEKLILRKSILFKELEFPGMTGIQVQSCLNENAEYIAIEQELRKLVVPDINDLLGDGHDIEAIYIKRLYDTVS